jgi:hypothetical protein
MTLRCIALINVDMSFWKNIKSRYVRSANAKRGFRRALKALEAIAVGPKI